MPEINFLRLQQEKLKQKTQRLFIVQVSALSLLVFYFLIVAGTFAYYFVLGKEANLLDTEIDTMRSNIQKAVGVETKEVYLKSKAANLSSILESAKSHQLIVEEIFSLLPQGVEINNFEVSPGGQISFSGKAISFDTLNQLLDNIQGQSQGKEITIYASTVNKISLSEKGDLSFDLTLYIPPLKSS
jgi:Tfp pilus assembly protein PilN